MRQVGNAVPVELGAGGGEPHRAGTWLKRVLARRYRRNLRQSCGPRLLVARPRSRSTDVSGARTAGCA